MGHAVVLATLSPGGAVLQYLGTCNRCVAQYNAVHT
jgi:hypothetical protein